MSIGLEMPVKRFLDVPVAATTPEGAADYVIDRAVSDSPDTFRLINAGTLSAAETDRSYWELLTNQGLNFPDGRPLASVLKRTSPQTVECAQVRGLTLFEHCLDRGRARQVRHFLLGTTSDTLTQLSTRITQQFPGAVIAGTFSPPFGQRSADDLAEQDAIIRSSDAHIVWVAMGTPKQDAEALRILRSTGVTTIAVGAAFDFLAGTKRDAPTWTHAVHLEWLFRLLTEPRRLWRRYLIGNARFVRMVLRHQRAQPR